uniref:Lipoprotein n=1 Tax=[Tolypothrix] sp. PCC 7415 TaxID=373957 RepID=A0A2P0ZG74_9CYAN|nr:hypothetical protein [[Tolypothrix] sp. PCC 7415]
MSRQYCTKLIVYSLASLYGCESYDCLNNLGFPSSQFLTIKSDGGNYELQ